MNLFDVPTRRSMLLKMAALGYQLARYLIVSGQGDGLARGYCDKILHLQVRLRQTGESPKTQAPIPSPQPADFDLVG